MRYYQKVEINLSGRAGLSPSSQIDTWIGLRYEILEFFLYNLFFLV